MPLEERGKYILSLIFGIRPYFYARMGHYFFPTVPHYSPSFPQIASTFALVARSISIIAGHGFSPNSAA
jgi:hypothetical protein